MDRFTTRPNPDQFSRVNTYTLDDDLNLEVWQKAGERIWVMTMRDDGKLVTHTAVGDKFAAKLLK